MRGTQRSVKISLDDHLKFTVTCPFCGRIITFDEDDRGMIKYWEPRNCCVHFIGVEGVGCDAYALFQTGRAVTK